MKLPAHSPSRFLSTDGFFDSECTNGMRSEFAKAAVKFYQVSCEMDDKAVVNTKDLITDLLHYLHSLGEDPLMVLQKAGECFEQEVGVSLGSGLAR
jgi:hypothetical protein